MTLTFLDVTRRTSTSVVMKNNGSHFLKTSVNTAKYATLKRR